MKEIIFDKEDLKALYPAECHFKSVLETSTLRNCSRQLVQQVAQIYEKVTGVKKNIGSCHTCQFNFMKEVGIVYFRSIEHYNKLECEKQEEPNTENQVQSNETQEENGTKEESVQPKSKGRPKGSKNKPRR